MKVGVIEVMVIVRMVRLICLEFFVLWVECSF